MKTRTTAACLLASAAGVAHAQSSATLFAIVDANVVAIKNGSATTFKGVGSDGLSSSRLGFRGVEDLGDGFKAGFWLEAAVAPDIGTVNSTRTWNRRSTVSLMEPRWGELRLGHDNTPMKNAIDAYDPFGSNGLGELVGNGTTTGILSTLGSGANTITRSDNMVSWFTPSGLGGIYGQLAVAPSEGASGSKYAGGRVGYASGPVDASAIYSETTVALDDKFKQWFVGGTYDMHVVKIGAEFIQGKYDSLAGGSRKQTVYQLGVTLPIGERHVLRADYIHGNMSGGAPGSGFSDADDARQFAVGYQYNLSKRAALYMTAAALRNSGASMLVIASGNPGMRPGETSKGINGGVRITF